MPTLEVAKSHVANQWAYDSPLLACRFSPSGERVVTSAEDNNLQLWNTANGERVVLSGHESWVHALQFNFNGSELISGGCDGRLIWWELTESQPKKIRTIEAHSNWIRAIALSPDGSHLASIGNDLVIRLWDAKSGGMIREWSGHEKHIYSVMFHADSQQLLTGDLAGKLHLWNNSDGKLVRSFDAKPLHTYEGGQQVDFGGVRALAMNAGSTQLVAGGLHKATNPLGAVHEPLILRYDFADGKLLRTHACEGITGGVIWRHQFLPDGNLLAVSGGSSGGFLLFFSDQQDKETHRFQLPSLARDMDLHATTLRVATVHYDRHLRISGLYAKAVA